MIQDTLIDVLRDKGWEFSIVSGEHYFEKGPVTLHLFEDEDDNDFRVDGLISEVGVIAFDVGTHETVPAFRDYANALLWVIEIALTIDKRK